MKRYFLTCLLVGIVFSLAASQTQFPSNFHYTKTANGMEVLIIEDFTVPLVHIEMAFKGGGYVETAEIDGLSHLYEHMIFNATEGYPTAKSFNDKLLELGIIANGNTDQEIVNYFFSLSSKNWKEGLDLFSKGILRPLFLETELKSEKLIVNDEFQRYEADPFFLLDRETDKRLWGEHFSRKNVIGSHQVILAATTEPLHQLHERYHVPNNSLLVVAGAINHTEVMEAINTYFARWEPSSIHPHEKFIVPEFKPLGMSQFFTMEHQDTDSPILLYAWQGPDTRTDPKAVDAATVLSNLLGSRSSLFYQRLVDEGLVLEYNFRSTSSKYVSSMYLEIYPNPDKVKEAIVAIENEMALISSPGYFSEDDLNVAKNLIAINEAYDQEELSEYINTVAYRWASADIDFAANYLNNIDNVSLSDVQTLIGRYLKGKNRSVGMILSPDKNNELDITLTDYFKTQAEK